MSQNLSGLVIIGYIDIPETKVARCKCCDKVLSRKNPYDTCYTCSNEIMEYEYYRYLMSLEDYKNVNE